MTRCFFEIPNPSETFEAGISLSDIGSSFRGEVVTKERYLAYENAFIDLITAFMQLCSAKETILYDLEKHFSTNSPHITGLAAAHPDIFPNSILDLHRRSTEGMHLNAAESTDMARLILRELLWCRLISRETHFAISFEFDFRMNILSEASEDDLQTIVKQANNHGIETLIQVCP
ncbi:MAG: hypothetical protein IJA85_00680 [Clostridia bacterium]|nr:hypothetical protein [Clostridia bacterium]